MKIEILPKPDIEKLIEEAVIDMASNDRNVIIEMAKRFPAATFFREDYEDGKLARVVEYTSESILICEKMGMDFR